MIRIGICHDDIFIGNAIVKEIKTIGIEMKEDLHVEIIEDFRRGLYTAKNYDALYLDITIPQINKIVVKIQLNEENSKTETAFAPAQDHPMEDSFKTRPLMLIRTTYPEKEGRDFLIKIEEELRAKKECVLLGNKGKSISFFQREIIYVESDNIYVKVHTKEEKIPTMIRDTLKNTEKNLIAHGFIRTHQRYIVNLFFVEKCESDQIFLYHKDKGIPISKKYKKLVMEALMKKNKRNIP